MVAYDWDMLSELATMAIDKNVSLLQGQSRRNSELALTAVNVQSLH